MNLWISLDSHVLGQSKTWIDECWKDQYEGGIIGFTLITKYDTSTSGSMPQDLIKSQEPF